MSDNADMPASQEPDDLEIGKPESHHSISPKYRSVYSNSANIAATPWDIHLKFATLVDKGDGDLTAEEQVSIIMSPQHAKIMALIFVDQIKKWEARFGPIRLSKSLIDSLGIEIIRPSEQSEKESEEDQSKS